MTKLGFYLFTFAVGAVAVSACAQGSTVLGVGGAGGEGSSAVTGTTAETSSGVGGDPSTTAGTGGAGTTTTSTTSSTTTTSTTTSTGSGMDCPAGQHFCGGLCAGNTPQTGCSASMSCTPCPAPQKGTSTCTPAGACDFTCPAPYTKSGNDCTCANECCGDADCAAGSTCQGGTCSMPAPVCDANACVALCIAECIIQGKLGIGICMPDGTCGCSCL